MSLSTRKWRDRLGAGAVCGVFAILGSGCGSGGGGQSATPNDAGLEGSTVLHRDGAALDAAGPSGDGALPDGAAPIGSGTTSAYDGTVGMKCQSDLDCQPDGGPGLTTCSATTFTDPIYPTPVCVLRTCDPGIDGLVHFCDGPDAPTSPGICLAVPGGGVCLPVCFFASDGSAPVGCKGSDTCSYYAATESSTMPARPVGVGYCFGGCVTNADCPTGSFCQSNTGACVTTVAPPTKAIGQPCTSADNGSAGADGGPGTAATCNCYLGATSTQGYCTQSCIVKSATASCPAGYTCDSFLPAQLMGADASAPGFSIQNTQLAGQCFPTCGEAGACPGVSTCSTADTAGPDCLLP